jgi:hypothetical protein
MTFYIKIYLKLKHSLFSNLAHFDTNNMNVYIAIYFIQFLLFFYFTWISLLWINFTILFINKNEILFISIQNVQTLIVQKKKYVLLAPITVDCQIHQCINKNGKTHANV